MLFIIRGGGVIISIGGWNEVKEGNRGNFR